MGYIKVLKGIREKMILNHKVKEKKNINVFAVLMIIMVLTAIITIVPILSMLFGSLTGDGFVTYNNEIYEPIYYWNMDDDALRKDIQVSIDGEKKMYSAVLYTEAGDQFIDVTYYNLLYHKTNTTLPSYEHREKIEKIVVNYIGNTSNQIVLGPKAIDSLIADIKSYDQKKQKIKKFGSLGTVDIYYLDYPAHYFCGYIIKTSEDKWGFCRLKEGVSGKIDEYILLTNQNLLD